VLEEVGFHIYIYISRTNTAQARARHFFGGYV
jgi:hypothetical protein